MNVEAMDVESMNVEAAARLRRCEPVLLQPRLQPPEYAPITSLKARQLHLLMLWESCEALKLAKSAGLETP